MFSDFSLGLFWYVVKVFTNLPGVYSSIKSSGKEKKKRDVRKVQTKAKSFDRVKAFSSVTEVFVFL